MFAKYAVGGRLDPPYYPTKTEPAFIGRIVSIPSSTYTGKERLWRDRVKISHDIEFFAISVQSSTTLFEDNWHLTVNGKIVVKNNYCFYYPEGCYFGVAHKVKAETEIIFEYYTNQNDKNEISIIYHMLTEPNINLVLDGSIEGPIIAK